MDTTPPTVSLTSPAPGATVSGSVTISATASDNVGVTSVDFRVDGNTVATDSTSPYSTSWNSASVADGSHVLTAVARDAAGNATTSASRLVTVANGIGAFPPLPSGNTGIAASFPNDTNIQTHANVIFAENFDAYTSASQLTSSGNWNNFYQAGNTTIATSPTFLGAASLRQRIPASAGEVANALVKLLADRDEIYVRGYIRFQSGFAGVNSAHSGVRISGNYTGPGQRPTGSDFFLVEIENSRYRNETEPGYTNAYVYHPEQNDVYGEHWYPSGFTSNGSGPDGGFGSTFVPRTDQTVTTATWISREVYVKLNTPGQRNGRIAVWDNGVIVADWHNIRFRDTTAVKIDELQFENGGQSSSQQNDKWLDNVVVATSYIGPSNADATPPTVAITAPLPGATVSGTNTVVLATAADNIGVAGVQFKLDGQPLQAEDTTSPYAIQWDTTTASNGSHTLTATARDAAGNTTTSAGIAVTVANSTAAAPAITGHPQNDTVSEGQRTSFCVTATGTPPLTFQWYKNGTPISGATSGEHRSPPAQMADNGAQFWVTVSNAGGSTTSSVATLTVVST